MRQEIYRAFRAMRLAILLTLSLYVWHADASVSINVVPGDQTVGVGANASFGVVVTASGGEVVTGYQWLMATNVQSQYTLVGTSQALILSNVQLSNAGYYYVIVSYRSDGNPQTLASTAVKLTVTLLPAIITQPASQIIEVGSNAVLSVTIQGALPLHVQWQFNGANLADNGHITGSSGTNLNIEDLTAADSGNYDVVITNLYGSATSQIASLTVSLFPPVITSPTNAVGQQGFPFNYQTMVTGTLPITFGAAGLPAGLSVNGTNGTISGIPTVAGIFNITLFATNAAQVASENLVLSLASDIPVVTSSVQTTGQQGQSFSYSINASNNPLSFFAGTLPTGLSINPSSGVISGVPLVTGSFAVTIGAMNGFGSGSQTLTINVTTGTPVITSSPTAAGAEEQTGFYYIITANNSPATFAAANLPMGLTINTNTGEITGTPLYAGNYTVTLSAANAWGVGTATLQLTVTDMAAAGLFVDGLETNYLAPYLLEFKFSLRDGPDLSSHAVVAPTSLMTVTAFEDGNPVNPTDTSVLLKKAESKVLKGYLVLDFSAGISLPANSNGPSAAAVAEIASAESFVNEQPADAQIGVYEYHREDEAPQQVMSLTTDKNLLDSAIAGIWTNYVQDFPAGSRAWDALAAATTALGPANSDESHYIVFMSDGQDDSSTATLDSVIGAATNASVQIYAVGFGGDVNTANLQTLTSSTLGQYYAAIDPADLALDFASIGKDLSSEYILRWATLNRSKTAFMPSFEITYQGFTADSPTNPPPFISGTNYVYDTNTPPDITGTNYVYTTNYIISPYLPPLFASNELAGSLRLVADAETNPTEITLRTTYAPRYIHQLHLHYRANWPATLILESTNPGQMLAGWTLAETNDGSGGQWATLSSPDPLTLADSIPFADFGKLLTFSFADPIVASNAFSLFAVDNTIYTNVAGTNFYGFTVQNTNSFFTFYAVPPPHGTPVPWLLSHGFTTNFAGAELLDLNGNGLTVWQDYLAGLNPRATNSTFAVQLASLPNAPQIVFNTAVNRTYRIEWTASLSGPWTILQDGIAGTGSEVTYTDQRDLSTVEGMFYRVVVEYP